MGVSPMCVRLEYVGKAVGMCVLGLGHQRWCVVSLLYRLPNPPTSLPLVFICSFVFEERSNYGALAGQKLTV